MVGEGVCWVADRSEAARLVDGVPTKDEITLSDARALAARIGMPVPRPPTPPPDSPPYSPTADAPSAAPAGSTEAPHSAPLPRLGLGLELSDAGPGPAGGTHEEGSGEEGSGEEGSGELVLSDTGVDEPRSYAEWMRLGTQPAGGDSDDSSGY